MTRDPNPSLSAAVGCTALLVAAVCLSLAFNDESTFFALSAVVVVVVCTLIIIQPYFGLLFYLAFLYLRPGDRVPEIDRFRLTLLLVMLTTTVWLAQYAIRKRPEIVRHKAQWYIAGLLISAVLSGLPYTVKGAVSDVFAGPLKTVMVMVLIANLARTPGRIRGVAWAVVLCSAANALLAWYDLHRGKDVFAGRAAGVGVLNDPNDLALTLVMAMPLALALLQGERGFYRRLVLLVTIATLGFGVLVSKSRGGLLGLVVVFFFEGIERIRSRQGRVAFGMLAIAVGVVGLSVLAAKRGPGLSDLGEDSSVSDRKGAWIAGFKMMRSHPLTGIGLYRFPDWTDTYGPEWMTQRHLVAHNSVVQVAGEQGVPGLVFFLLLLGHMWQSTGRIRERLREQPAGRLMNILGFSLRRALIGWFTCACFLAQAWQVWLYILIGLIVATETMLRRTEPAPAVAA